MSRVYVISDLHLGHKNILEFSGKYRDWADSVLEHDHILIEKIRSVCCSKRDILYILGDVCFDLEKLEMLDEIPAKKILVRGNHDKFPMEVYSKYFESVQGIMNYKKHWLTHAPIHPQELRGRKNVHGHVHFNSIMKSQYTQEYDENYINVCVENTGGYPVNFEDIQDGSFKGLLNE